MADPAVLALLKDRLARVHPDARRRWGTLTPHEMLCHLSDSAAMVLLARPRTTQVPDRSRPLVRFIGLWAPVPWPHGWPTNPMLDPKAEGTKPSEFAKDLARAVAGLEGIARARPGDLEPLHGVFGRMSVRDWQRWAFRHTNHHLCQFGL